MRNLRPREMAVRGGPKRRRNPDFGDHIGDDNWEIVPGESVTMEQASLVLDNGKTVQVGTDLTILTGAAQRDGIKIASADFR